MKVRIGDLLLQEGTISAAQLEEALKYQVIFGGRIGTNLIELGMVSEDDIARVLGKKFGVPAVNARQLSDIPREVLARFPRELAERWQVLPLAFEGRRVTVATTAPGDLAAVDAIAFVTGLVVRTAVVSELSMAYALEQHYGIQRDRRFIHASRQFGRQGRNSVAEQDAAAAAPQKPRVAATSDGGLHFEVVEDLGGIAEPTMYHGDGSAAAAASPSSAAAGAVAVADIWPDDVPAPVAPPLAPVIAAVAVPPAPPASPAPVPTPPVVAAEEEIPDAETVSDNLAGARDRDDVLNTVAAFLACEFPRSALFLVRGEAALGWRATLDGVALKDFDQVRLPMVAPSLLKTVADSRSFSLGPIPRSASNAELVMALGGRLPETALLVPLQMMGRVVAIIYVDGAGSDLGDRLLDLQKLTAKAAMAFEILVLKNKILSM